MRRRFGGWGLDIPHVPVPSSHPRHSREASSRDSTGFLYPFSFSITRCPFRLCRHPTECHVSPLFSCHFKLFSVTTNGYTPALFSSAAPCFLSSVSRFPATRHLPAH